MCTARRTAILQMLLPLFIVLASLPGGPLSVRPARAAGTCYVDDSAGGANDGTDWANAYINLQDALIDSCAEIWVAAGTYRPHASDRTVSFMLENGTAIYGGFAGMETMRNQRDWETNVTILSGDLAGDDSGFTNNGENSYHVVSANSVDNTAILDGFTISGGNANGTNPDDRGGGIYSASSTSTLTNLTFTSNYADLGGGGIFVGPPSGDTLTNVTFSGNTASSGGGLYSYLSNVSLSGVTIRDNSASYGGGMFSLYQIPTLTNVTFSGNSANVNGGGLYTYGSSPILTNVTVSNNSAGSFGGGFYNDFNGTPVFTNVIIANSLNGGDCVLSSGSINATSRNNLIEDSFASCGLTNGVDNNIVGTDPGLGALTDNGGPTQTYLPGAGSAAIDAGTNTGCTATDQRGASRPQNSTCDIGAVELAFQSGPTRTVTKLADTNAVCDMLTCSLREAIASASSGNTISFASSLSGGTIYLDLSNTLNIFTNITIDGSTLPSTITISGDSDHNGMPDVTVFYVGLGVNATLNNLIITKGYGGLYNNGTATVNNSIFSANNIDNQQGGAIKNTINGTLTVNNSTFTGNIALNGGAIANFNHMTVANSTFVNNGNGATDSGGAIYTDANALPGLIQTITNSTFSGNMANQASAIYSRRTQTIANSTFSGNVASYPAGYAVYQDQETLNLSNTIIANSTNGDCISNGMGTNTNTLVEDGGCAAAMSGDPKLGALANNGGPTQTFALLPGSPAIGAGDDATCAAAPVSGLDQRGITRPNGDHCDLGAYEHQDTGAPAVTAFAVPSSATSFTIPITTFTAVEDGLITGYLITESSTPPAVGAAGWTALAPSSYTVSSVGTHTLYPWARDDASNVSAVYGSPRTVYVCLDPAVVTSTADSGGGSLRQAIADACTGGTVTFHAALSGATIHLSSTLSLTKDVTIDGSALAAQITLSGDSDNDGTGDVRVMGVASNLDVVLDSLTITRGQANEAGAIFNEADLTIRKSNIVDNSSTGYAGAISGNGPLTIIDSTFAGNTALGNNQGAGAILTNNNVTITGSTFSSNTATVGNSAGGAIYNTDPDTTISNSTFSGNAAGTGGAIYTTTSMEITNSTFSDNSATNAGGIYIDGGTTNLENTIIANSSGGDCTNATIGLGTNSNNLIEDGSCYPALSGDPKLGALANNGGSTHTMALLPGSPAINAGDDATCAAAPISNLDQRGLMRSSNGMHCDIGAFEYQDSTAPTVVSSVRAGSNPSNAASVDFMVTFSEAVTGVTTDDFSLVTTGVTNTAVISVSADTGSTRTVTVNTGSGNGTIRLDLLDDDSILDVASNPLAGGLSSGESYTIDKTVTLTLTSTAARDGWVLESSETSGVGGTLNSGATTFRVGDDATNRQYRGLLSFTTAGIPDSAIITGVTLKVKREKVVGGGKPLTSFQGFMVDLKKGRFGTTAVELGDFQAKASKTLGPASPALVSGWYSLDLLSGKQAINTLAGSGGVTQVRLRFKRDDNNNASANYLSLYSGNAGAASRPQLVIQYYVP